MPSAGQRHARRGERDGTVSGSLRAVRYPEKRKDAVAGKASLRSFPEPRYRLPVARLSMMTTRDVVLGAMFRRNGAGAPLRCDCVCKV